MIVSDIRHIHCTRFSSEFYQVVYRGSHRNGNVLIIPEHHPDKEWNHYSAGRKMDFSCISFRGIETGNYDWNTRYFVKEDDRWLEVQY